MKNPVALFCFIFFFSAVCFKSSAQPGPVPVPTPGPILEAFPDLVPSVFRLVSIVPEAESGGLYYYTFRGTVTNRGNATANTSNVSLQLLFSDKKSDVAPAEFDSSYVRLCGFTVLKDANGSVVNSLAPNRSVTFTVSGSCNVYGWRYAMFYVDATNVLNEAKEKNNCTSTDMHPAPR